MNIKLLSNPELMNRFGKLVQTERKITHLVLECIAEIDTRKIFLERAYPSLYEFLVKEFGYSPSSAVRRIESARLLRDIPEVSEKIADGALNLSQLSKVQQAIRLVQKTEDRKIDVEEKRDLLRKIEFATQNQTEQILAQELALPSIDQYGQQIHQERGRIHGDGSVTLTITFSKEQMALLEQVQNMIAHSVPEKKWSEVMSYLAQKEIARRTQIKRLTPKNEAMEFALEENSDECHSKTRKPIRSNLRKTIMAKEKCCQYKDPLSKKKCGSTRFLQIDHIKPVWAGGDNSSENLRILCQQHNNFKYAKESGLHPIRL